MEYNLHIDFASMFDDLYGECRGDLEDSHEQCCKHIIDFYDSYRMEDFEIIHSDCEFTDDKILFVFGKEFNDKNESDPVGTSANVYITFDKKSEMFTEYEYEQG